jgi:hypothetical protein
MDEIKWHHKRTRGRHGAPTNILFTLRGFLLAMQYYNDPRAAAFRMMQATATAQLALEVANQRIQALEERSTNQVRQIRLLSRTNHIASREMRALKQDNHVLERTNRRLEKTTTNLETERRVILADNEDLIDEVQILEQGVFNYIRITYNLHPLYNGRATRNRDAAEIRNLLRMLWRRKLLVTRLGATYFKDTDCEVIGKHIIAMYAQAHW